MLDPACVEIGIVIAEQPAPAPHLAHPEGCAALRIVLVTVPRVSRSCEHCPDGFDLHLLPRLCTRRVQFVPAEFEVVHFFRRVLFCTQGLRWPSGLSRAP